MITPALPRAPRVFVSHSSEDRERFVEPFSRQLRANRVDAWLSFWEMAAGDSLPQKIFDEGIGAADVVVVVVSATSVNKPWVRAEIETATAQRIAGNVRMIAVVLERVPVLVQLSSLLWIPVPEVDATSITVAAKTVIDAVYGSQPRPPLGDAPPNVVAAAKIEVALPRGLTTMDTVVLREAARQSLVHRYADLGNQPLEFDTFVGAISALDVSAQQVSDAVEVLTSFGYVDANAALGRRHPITFRVTTAGMDAVIASLVDNYANVRSRVAAALINENVRRSNAISLALGVSQPVVDHILRDWESTGWLSLSQTIEPVRQVVRITPHLRRWLLG